MTTVKFDKSVKYQGVRYAAHEVFKVDDEDVAELKKAGATVLAVETPDAPPAPETAGSEDHQEADAGEEQESSEEEQAPEEDVAELKEKLLEYTVAELVKFAEVRGIDLQKKTKKAEIYNIIVAALD